MISKDELLRQSQNAYGQWGKQWADHAKIHAKDPRVNNDMNDLDGVGHGKAALCVANGRSFQDNLDVIKEHQDNVDVIACDKTLGSLISHGITPQYAIVMDANVSYEEYMEPWKDKLQDTVLIVNVCGNPEWTKNGNWKEVYFTVQRDVMHNEIEFSQLSGCKNLVPAGTNVSNGMIVMLTQCDERGPNNFFGYDKILTIGFDYCWARGKYYAFNDEAGGKQNYMRHLASVATNGELVYTSTNLHFSARWLADYTKYGKVTLVQCSHPSIFRGSYTGDLAQQMQYTRVEDNGVSPVLSYRDARQRLRQLDSEANGLKVKLKDMLKNQRSAVLRTI